MIHVWAGPVQCSGVSSTDGLAKWAVGQTKILLKTMLISYLNCIIRRTIWRHLQIVLFSYEDWWRHIAKSIFTNGLYSIQPAVTVQGLLVYHTTTWRTDRQIDSKEWHGIENQPHPHPIPTKHIPISIPNPVDSCIRLWNLQVHIMQHIFVCKQTLGIVSD